MKITLMASKSTFIVEHMETAYLVDIIGTELDDYAVYHVKYVEDNSHVGSPIIIEEIIEGIKRRNKKINE